MKNKLFAIALCFLLLLSGLIVVAQGAERTDGANEVDEDGIGRDQKGDGSIENATRERMDESTEWRSEYGSETGFRGHSSLNRQSQSIDESRDLSWESTSEEENDRVLSESPKPLLNYTVVDPIRIDDNSELATEAISGSGTDSDPYLIEGYEIDGGGYGYSLYIGNVTDHFEVNECYLHNASGGRDEYFLNSGLHLFNTSNGYISGNVVSNNSQNGVYLDHTSNNRVSNNTVHSNEGHEILLDESDDNKVMNNDILGDDFSSDQLGSQDDVEYCQDSVLVKLESPDEDRVRNWGEERALKFKTDDIANTIEGRTSRTYPAFDMAEIAISEDVGVKEAVSYLNGMDEVIKAEPNYLMDFQNIPNDPGYDSLSAMPTIDAPEAWDITTGSEEVVVAVMDTGIDYTHPDLRENMWTSDEGHHGYNAVNDSYDPMDDFGHGTHVAGTIGAVGDNDLGVVGVNWEVSLMGIKIGDMGGLTTANAIAGLEYVLEKKREGENIIATSNSWGEAGYSELLYEAIEQHQEEDISFVAAAGNSRADADETPFYPANYDLTNVISVAATDVDNNLAMFSNYGKRSVHVGAPGVEINSTMLDGEYGHASGTSMAAPHVSGLMALIASHEPTYDHNQLKNAILSSADSLDSLQNLTLTDGRINANEALEISPDPDDIRFWVHRPTSKTAWGEETSISISLNDGVNPVLGANVSVEFSTGEDKVYLEDDGSRGDLPGDGYYTGGWTPRNLGEVGLTITAKLEDDREMTKNLTVEITGDSGIALLESQDNVLGGNNLTRNFYGISIYNSESNEIIDDSVESSDWAGIRLYESRENEFIDQDVSDSEYGLLFERSNENSVFNSNISNTLMGAMLQDSESNTFSNNLLSKNFYGFSIETSRENKFIENELLDNLFGMIFYQSSNNVIDSSTIDNQMGAVLLQSSENNLVTDNTLTDIGEGIFLWSADGNELHNNEFSTDMYAVYLQNSEGTTLTENTMIDGGIYIESLSIEHWNTHSIDTSNT
ncbi:MAG: S8 family serine peptidase, partial [Candidatus Natronoplasma sp.]